MKNFKSYNLSQNLLKALDLMGYHQPTQVQSMSIPAILKNKDLIIKSETGSGKTAAFAIPIIDQVEWEERAPQVLVLTPTRELAQQVRQEVFNIGRFKRMQVVEVYGKSPIRAQIRALSQRTHFVVGTPGRVYDHIERGTLDLTKIKYLVLDEADEMLNMGFREQIDAILECIREDYTMTVLSATMPDHIKNICDEYMDNPEMIEIESGTNYERIEQMAYKVSRKDKLKLVKDLMVVENPDSCIIFCNTRAQVDEINDAFKELSYPVNKLHGGMEQDVRTKVMTSFRKGHFRYLIATDVAARGIDVDDISLVINYDLPEDAEVYVHRIGRTGRKDKEGRAVSFVNDQDQYFLSKVSQLTQKEMILREQPSEDEVEVCLSAFEDKLNERLIIKHEKHKALSKEITKLHINAGKKTKMRAGDVVGAISNIPDVTADDIGNINIADVSTFVEILNNKGKIVYKALQNKPIKGRIRKVSYANE